LNDSQDKVHSLECGTSLFLYRDVAIYNLNIMINTSWLSGWTLLHILRDWQY